MAECQDRLSNFLEGEVEIMDRDAPDTSPHDRQLSYTLRAQPPPNQLQTVELSTQVKDHLVRRDPIGYNTDWHTG